MLCFGIALANRCQLPIIPTDLFPRDLSNIIGAKYSRVKISFDVICLAVTGLMTGLFLGHLDGLGIGTVLAAFTMGKVVGLMEMPWTRKCGLYLFFPNKKRRLLFRSHHDAASRYIDFHQKVLIYAIMTLNSNK